MAVDVRGLTPLLLVRDLPRSIAFYRDVLGFGLVAHSGPDYKPGWALLGRGGSELMLNGRRASASPPSAEDLSRDLVHGDTALYFGCPDLDGAFQHFRGHGVDVEPPARTGYGFRSLELRDPDGYTLVLHWPDTPDTRQDWEVRYGMPGTEG